MDHERRKELVEEFKQRKPEMGVVRFLCLSTGDAFVGISKDAQASYNSNRFKLSMHLHPNKALQELWDAHGEEGFSLSVVSQLDYENVSDVESKDLDALWELYLEEHPQARVIWKNGGYR